jgi:hypothetical protein
MQQTLYQPSLGSMGNFGTKTATALGMRRNLAGVYVTISPSALIG